MGQQQRLDITSAESDGHYTQETSTNKALRLVGKSPLYAFIWVSREPNATLACNLLHLELSVNVLPKCNSIFNSSLWKALFAAKSSNKLWVKVQRWLGFHPALPQRYYPQCVGCSNKQAQAVKMDRRTLVAHMAGPRPWHFSGTLHCLLNVGCLRAHYASIWHLLIMQLLS